MTESRLADRPPEFWIQVATDYVGNELKVPELLAKHDLTLGEFNYARLRFRWTRRNTPPVKRELLIKRLFRLLDQMLEQLEAEMTTTGEKEVTILGKLVQSMGKLIELETATNAEAAPRQTKDMHDIRRKLVERIEDLKRA